MNKDRERENNYKHDCHKRQYALSKKYKIFNDCVEASWASLFAFFQDNFLMLIQEECSKYDDRGHSVVQQPPLSCLHVRGGW